MPERRQKPLIYAVILLALIFITSIAISGCQASPQPAEPTKKPVDQAKIKADWDAGGHSMAYDLGKGPNDFCSRCHSPQNWDPASSVSAAPNCVTCKFATDKELRIAPTMKLVEEKDWKGIPCETCHQTEKGVVTTKLVWFDPIKKTYEKVSGVNALCEKCHATTQGVKFTGGRGVDHKVVLSGSAHLNYAGAWPQTDRPDQCTDCHDPHTLKPKGCLDCHPNVASLPTHMKGTSAKHANVTCQACHDASGKAVGPDPTAKDNPKWITLVSSLDRATGKTTSAPSLSHSMQWQVSCDRCHFAKNPNNLTVLTADGKVPTPAPVPSATPTK